MKRLLFISILFAAGSALADDTLRPPPRLHVGGFADVVVHTQSGDVGSLDLFSTLRMTDDWSGLVEVVAQKTWQTGRKATEAGELNLERLYLSYRPSDAFRLELGQTHTSIVRWNEREHRSRFLQTPIEVPAIARRPQDDGAWPLLFVGAWASGRAPGKLGLTWELGAGAGPGLERDSFPIFSSNRSPAGFLAISFAPEDVPGFDAGVSLYAQHIPTKPDALRERDFTLFTNYVNNGTEIRAEFARMDHHMTRIPRMFRNQGYYVLLSKRLRGVAERARPYVLIDHLNLDPLDPYLTGSTNENALAAGLRYDFTNHVMAKGELRSQRGADGGREATFGVEIGISF